MTSMLQVQVLLYLSVGDIHVTGMGDTVSLLVTSMLQLQVSCSSLSACDIHVTGTDVTVPLCQ